MKTVFSGIQPSGNLHLGNYLGSIANWVGLQNQQSCIFGIMDLHAITVPQDPKQLRRNILDCAIVYLAAGLNPAKTIIFPQSAIKEHLELSWIFACLTPLGWLNRMTQFKDKSENNNEHHNLGLYAYPALMAADILLYKTDFVPVGEDQKQHLELARDIAGAFNRHYDCEYFKLPEPQILGAGKRIMSLIDGTKKMSKSEASDLSRINLDDDADLIRKKIKKCKTDSIRGITYDAARVEIFNLLNIFAACVGAAPQEVAQQNQNSNFGKFKDDLAEAIINKIAPIQKNIAALKNDLTYVEKILAEGINGAQQIASKNIQEIKKIVGLY